MNYFELIKQAGADWLEDKAMRLSAALAYYSVFSLAPLLIVAISIAGLVFGQEAASGAIEEQLTSSIGKESASAVEEMIESTKKSGDNVLMTVLGSVVLLISASGVFAQLKDAMNTIWEIEPTKGDGFKKLVLGRLLSLGMVLVIGFLLLISLVASTAMAAVNTYASGLVPIHPAIWQTVTFLISFIGATVLFALIFKVLPDAVIEWKDVWVGAAITALLFSIGKFLLGLYLGREGAESTYGAAGALLLVLTWVYYTSNIVLFGAEFTQVYSRERGHKIMAKDGFKKVDAEAQTV